jgi:hypothetical protein
LHGAIAVLVGSFLPRYSTSSLGFIDVAWGPFSQHPQSYFVRLRTRPNWRGVSFLNQRNKQVIAYFTNGGDRYPIASQQKIAA